MSADSGFARSAGAAGAATFASRILGLVRDQVFLAMYGAGNDMDAFTVAFRIPNLVRDLFAEGAMSAAFVPAFTRHLTLHGKAAAWRLGSNVMSALLLVTGVLVTIGIIFTAPLASLFAGDYAAVPGKLELTIQLTRVMLPFLTLAAIAAAMMGMLNSLHHYFVPALSPAMFNVATIAAAVLLTPAMVAAAAPPITAIAAGALLGGVGQILLQWRALHGEGFRYHFAVDWRDPGLRRILLLMGPGTIGLAATQVNVFVNTLLATGEGTGAASWLSYGFRLMYLPIGLFGVSIATVVLPMAARHAAVDDPEGIRRTVSRGLGLMLALNVPATVGLFVLSLPIVRVLFEHGRFQPSDSEAVASALRFYSLGLVGYSAARIASPVFYAVGRNRVPVLISVASVGINVLASLLLVGPLGFRGLALGTSIAALVHGCGLLLLLWNALGGLEVRRLLTTFGKVLAASGVMAGAAVWTQAVTMPSIHNQAILARATSLTASIAAGLVALAVAAKVVRLAEFDDITARLRLQVRMLLDR